MNIDDFISNYDFNPLIEKLLKDNNILPGENTYSRHQQEIRKFTEKFRKSMHDRNYFQDLPTLNDDFSSFVVLINTPFVEEAKRDKFKTFMAKKVAVNFKDRIKDYIFPYTDADKDKLKDGAMIMLQFESNEEAKLAAQALNGAQIDKTRKGTAVAYLDYDKVLSMDEKYTKPDKVNFVSKFEWENNNLTEMIYLKNPSHIKVMNIHYLKKELSQIYSIPNENIINMSWSPQGKYLVVSETDKINLYSGDQSVKDHEISVHAKDYSISNDEKYMITFIGYSESKEDTEQKQLKENVFIRDIDNNELIRGIAINKDEHFSNFKWSYDSAYFGRIKKEILIIYGAPKMQIIMDPVEKKRHPIMDNVKKFEWFPNKNVVLAVSEKYSQKKLVESQINFIEIPSRNQYSQASLMDLEIISFKWHKSNSILAVLCKKPYKTVWSVRLFHFEKDTLTYRSGHADLPKSNKETPYYDMSLYWMDNNIFVITKHKENNLDTLCVFPYKYDKKKITITPWVETGKALKNLKHSNFLPSNNGTHFLLACLDTNNSNSYGKVDLYAIFDNKINFCKNMEFGQGVENIKWDEGGRLFVVEITKKKENDGMRIFNCKGNLVYDYKDSSLVSTAWRPRHFPLLDRFTEYEKIEKEFNKIKTKYDEEDAEFLSEIDKTKRAIEKQKRDKFNGIASKRKQKWQEEHKEKIQHDKEPPKLELHEFWIEEIIKTEETLLVSDTY